MFRLFVCYKQQAKKTFSSFQPFSSTFGYIVCVSLRFAPRVDFALHILLYVHQQWIYVWAPLDTFTISFLFIFSHIPIASTFVNLFFHPRTYEWVSEQTKQHIHPEIYSWHTRLFSFFSIPLTQLGFHQSTFMLLLIYVMLNMGCYWANQEKFTHSTKLIFFWYLKWLFRIMPKFVLVHLIFNMIWLIFSLT